MDRLVTDAFSGSVFRTPWPAFEHGALRLSISKAETAKPRKVAIRTAGHEAIPAETVANA